ncbi:hypothetical protein AA313_de0202608 [Arthrobotrys entomopaga]|nr:hypothetical protein AA313_de0202608 [Arthrobotrys entomopaga]
MPRASRLKRRYASRSPSPASDAAQGVQGFRTAADVDDLAEAMVPPAQPKKRRRGWKRPHYIPPETDSDMANPLADYAVIRNRYQLAGSDITIVVGQIQKKFHIHSAVICDHSISIKNEFNARLERGRSSKVLQRPRIDPAVFQELVEWMYAGDIPLSKDRMDREHLQRFFAVISDLNMPKLGKEWFDKMGQLLREEVDTDRKSEVAFDYWFFLWDVYSNRYLAAGHGYLHDLVWDLSPYLRLSAETVLNEENPIPQILRNSWIIAREKMISRMCDSCITKLYIDRDEQKCYTCSAPMIENENEEPNGGAGPSGNQVAHEYDEGNYPQVPLYGDQNAGEQEYNAGEQEFNALGEEFNFDFDTNPFEIINLEDM